MDNYTYMLYTDMEEAVFEWDPRKDLENRTKHGVSFAASQYAFCDHNRVIREDSKHSNRETRFYCSGRVGEGILTVRFTLRANRIRIIGAGFWREGRSIYEKENKIH